MARPERNTVDYFPFYCDEGKKMYYIEETYGNDGFAVFMKILRELAKTDYHHLNLNEKSTEMFIAAKCKVSFEKLDNIISDLAKLGKFDLELWNHKIIWCQDFIDGIQDAYKKRNNKCITKHQLGDILRPLGILLPTIEQVKVPVKTQRKEKERKEEESISLERQTIFQFFYFEKNFKEPYFESNRFWDHYSSVGWKDANANEIIDKLGKAKQWTPNKSGLATDIAVLNKWKQVFQLVHVQEQGKAYWLLHFTPKIIDGKLILNYNKFKDYTLEHVMKILESDISDSFFSSIKTVFKETELVYALNVW